MCAKDYLFFDMEDVTLKTHNAKFMVKKIYDMELGNVTKLRDSYLGM